MYKRQAKVVVKVPLKSTVKVSPTTVVVILVPPAIVNVSACAFAVVDPVSPSITAHVFNDERPDSSS